MKKRLILISALLLSTNVALAKVKVPYTHQGFYSTAPTQLAIHFVSLNDIEKSLVSQKPMTVSFDIDDTVLFSSGYFHYGFTFGKELGFGDNPRAVLSSPKFWDFMADNADEMSIPKESAKKLIEMHVKRGDKIVFITGRTPHSKAKNCTVTATSKTLQRYFNMPEAPVICYTSSTPRENYQFDKSYFIKNQGSQLHYGDSDDDILAAKEVGVRGIRVQRSYSSTNAQNLNGGYGEEVLVNSAW